MVECKKFIVFILLLLPVFNTSYAIESAAHKVEVAKCVGVIMTIKNNSKYEENIFKATNVLELYLDKILSLNIGSIMMKEMSEKAAKEVFNSIDNHTSLSLDNLLNKCINTLRIG